jgi:surface protein
MRTYPNGTCRTPRIWVACFSTASRSTPTCRNVSNATDLSCMFCNCQSFNADVSQWNVSNATDLNHMFHSCRSFNADVSQWDVSKATDLSYMFRNCRSFNADISQWNVLNVTSSAYMFSGCCSFNKTVVAGWPLSPATRQLLLADVYFHDADDQVSSPGETDDDDADEMSSQDDGD